MIIIIFLFYFISQNAQTCTDYDKSSLHYQDLLDEPIATNWHSPYSTELAWVLSDHTLQSDNSTAKHFGADLVSVKKYQNFIFTFKFRYAKGANSGIKYLIQDTHGNIGLEYQIVDDLNHKDSKKLKNQTAALYDLFPAVNKVFVESNNYNEGCIYFNNGIGEHWLNGKKVLSYNLSSENFSQAVKQSKFKTFDWFGTYSTGKILLQHHGDKVFFRDFKIYELRH